jgi:hypothetical protein
MEIDDIRLEEVAHEVHHFTVSFVLPDKSLGQDFVSGSGTLVSAGDKVGILTAKHVADLFTGESKQPVALVIAKSPHRFILQSESFRCIDYLGGLGPTEESGPDISFLQLLSPESIETIKARKSVYRLDGKSYSQFPQFESNSFRWFVAGALDEFADRKQVAGYPNDILQSTVPSLLTIFESLESKGTFDILKLKALAGELGYPGDYGGISGGGVWFSIFRIDPDRGIESLTADPPFLAGVEYCQGDRVDEAGCRTLICHGPSSIYDYVGKIIAAA